MAKSRLALSAAALSAMDGPALAQDSMTAEQVTQAFEERWPSVAEIDCPKAADGEEILVCGRAGRSSYRVPASYVPAGRGRLPGETVRASDALANGSSRCSTVGRNQSCGGGLPVIPIALFLVDAAGKAVQAIKEKGDE